MTLISSISGTRGTIGGVPGEALTPVDITRFTSAYIQWVKERTDHPKIVIGRDARPSGEMVSNIVCGVLMSMGADVLDLGLATTPTVEMAVTMEGADGGIIITASHNPENWNALKLLNHKGEFISAKDGERILALSDQKTVYADTNHLGNYTLEHSYLEKHIDKILELPLVD